MSAMRTPRSMTDLPRPLCPPGRRMGQFRVDAALDQLRLAFVVYLPVLPLETPQPMTHPAVQVPQYRWRLAETKGAHPPAPIRCEGRHDVPEAAAWVPSREGFPPRCEPGQGLWDNFPSCGELAPCDTTPQDTPVPGAIDGALLPVPLALEALRDNATDTRHHPRPGAGAAHRDIALIGVATEPMASRFTFLIPFVSHPIGQAW